MLSESIIRHGCVFPSFRGMFRLSGTRYAAIGSCDAWHVSVSRDNSCRPLLFTLVRSTASCGAGDMIVSGRNRSTAHRVNKQGGFLRRFFENFGGLCSVRDFFLSGLEEVVRLAFILFAVLNAMMKDRKKQQATHYWRSIISFCQALIRALTLSICHVPQPCGIEHINMYIKHTSLSCAAVVHVFRLPTVFGRVPIIDYCVSLGRLFQRTICSCR